jgi:hypothetical protein
VRVRVPVALKNQLLRIVHTGSGAHQASYAMGVGALSRGLKRKGRGGDHSPPTLAEVKEKWI